MRRFEYFAPQTLAEAVSLLKERGDGVRLLAGGTDLLVQMKEAGLHPPVVVSLHAIEDLRGTTGDASSGLRIGARTLMSEIESNAAIRERYSALSDGAAYVGSVQTRNLATIGGNVCNAAPSADTAPPLVVLDAVAEIAGSNGTRTAPVEQLFTGPGSTNLATDEIAVAFTLPAFPAHTGSVYQRHTPRKIMDIAAVSIGARLTLDGDSIAEARLCLGAVGPTVIRATEAEQALTGQAPSDELFERAGELARAASSPISDTRGSAEFRRYLVGVMTKRCLGIALERAQAG